MQGKCSTARLNSHPWNFDIQFVTLSPYSVLSSQMIVQERVSVSWLSDSVWFCEMCFWINTPIDFGQ